MRVLYVNHSSQMSGAERTLVDLMSWLPSTVKPLVACPEGALAETVRRAQIKVFPIPELNSGLRMHPWYTAAGLLTLLRTAVAVRLISRRCGAELVHANSIRAGLAAVLASRLAGPPTLVYLHDCLPANGLAWLARRLLATQATRMLANSRYTATNFADERSDIRVAVVHSPVDLDRFDPARVDRGAARRRLGLPPSAIVLSVIGQITPWKGQDDAIRILARLRSRHPSARLLIVGEAMFVRRSATYDNRTYRESLGQLTRTLNVADAVNFLGYRKDIPEILAATDIALVPSWQEPFGLAVTEAMAMGVPVLATNRGGPAELIRHGEDGLLLSPRAPVRWATTLDEILAKPGDLKAIGRRARTRARTEFHRDRYMTDLLKQYSETLRASNRWVAN